MKPPNSRPVLVLALPVLLWASAFPAVRVGLDGYGVTGLAFLRAAVASAALLLIAPLLKVRRPTRALPLAVFCGVDMAGYQVLLNWSEVHVPAGTASLLVATAPVFSVLVAASILGERLTTTKVLGIAVAVGGGATIALAGGGARYSNGAWIALAAAVVQGVYHAASKPLLRDRTSFEVTCYTVWAGAVALLPFLPATVHAASHASASATLSAVFLGLFPSVVGFLAWGYATARSTVTAVTASLYLIPPVSIAVSYVWLGEVPHLVALAGGLVSIAGVVLINRRPARRPVASPQPEATDPSGSSGTQAVTPAAALPSASATSRR